MEGWLNAVLGAEFAGKRICEQNLSDWCKYGYQQ